MDIKSNQDRIFSYDNYMDYTYLKNLFEKANSDFLLKDFDLINSDVNEKSLCGALKSSFEQYLQAEKICDYFVDVEYNRNEGGVIKTIIDDRLEIVKITCDLILHSRGHNIRQDNLLALEMKKSYRSQEEKDADRKRLIALTKSTYDNDIWSFDGKTFPEHVCRYIIGVYYEIDREQNKALLEFYRQGRKVAQETMYFHNRKAMFENKTERNYTTDKAQIFEFIAEQKTAFIASVNEQGYPVVRAMLAPRKIDGNDIYFTTNTSSNKIKHYLANSKACVYFYKRGKFKYRGVSITGEMQVCTDQATKDEIWRFGDKMFYKEGVTDPDYCVLKFTCKTAEYYCDFKTETIEL